MGYGLPAKFTIALGANCVTQKGLPAILCLHLWEVSRSIAKGCKASLLLQDGEIHLCFPASFSFGREFILDMFLKVKSISEKDLRKVFCTYLETKWGRILCQ